MIDLKQLIYKLKGRDVNEIVRNEIALMKSLDHKNLLKLDEALEDENSKKIYLVMEFCLKGAVMSEAYWKVEQATHDKEVLLSINRCVSPHKARKYLRNIVEGLDYRSLVLTSAQHGDDHPQRYKA